MCKIGKVYVIGLGPGAEKEMPSHSGSLPAALVWKGTFYPETFPVSVPYIRYTR